LLIDYHRENYMVTRILASSFMPLAFAVAFVATAQTLVSTLTAEQLKTLVNGKTLAIGRWGDPTVTDPGRTAYWDFKADGLVCGRFHGSKAGTKCADTGKWRLQGDTLCWDFQWMGESHDYKSLCVRAHKAEGKNYQLIDTNGKLPPVLSYSAK
jgi:ABC-type transport system substrate-binding protein